MFLNIIKLSKSFINILLLSDNMIDMAIATMCWDKKNPKQTLEALAALRETDIPVYVADAGSSRDFVKKLEKMGYDVECVEGSLTFQHKNAIQRAAKNAKAVLYTEPDKRDWFKKGLKDSVEFYLSHDYDFVTVSRSKEQIRTFPSFQQKTEGLMNSLIKTETGINGDFIYGPKIFKSELAKELDEIQTDVGWGVLMFLVGRAHKLGYKIGVSYTAANYFPHKKKEHTQYRMKQLVDNNHGFWLGLSK
jgi:hypothetical protein